MAKASKPTAKQLAAVEGTKADEAHHKRGIKEGSRKDKQLDAKLAVKKFGKKGK